MTQEIIEYKPTAADFDTHDSLCTNGSDVCFNGRYIKTNDLISKSQYRTIYRGYDNDSGCEIAWCVYPLKLVQKEDVIKIISALDNIKKLRHQYILMCGHYDIR